MTTISIIPKPTTEYDLRLLRIFCTVVECGGFAAAENTLGITRSTISVHMGNLEARMKLKLCLRGRGGFSLTEDGLSVYRGVVNLFESLNDFSLLVETLGKELSGELVILCADQLDNSKQKKIAQVVQKIYDYAPNLHITLDNDSITNIQKLLLNDKAHVAVIPEFHHIDGLNYQALFKEPIYLCCAKEHEFFDRPDSTITSEELAKVPAIHPGIDLDNKGKEQLKKLNLLAKSYQFDTRKTMILSGRYLGYMPQSYIKDELDKGLIRIIKANQLTYQFNLSLVSKKFPREIKKSKLLIDTFNEVFHNRY